MKLPRTVYLIRHTKTGRVYIGTSCRPEKRIEEHLYKLRSGCHPVGDMQQDFDTYGEDYAFEFLEVITGYKDRMREYEWMEKYNSHIRGVGYNYKDYANRKRVRGKNPNRTKLLKLISGLTDEEAEKFVAYLEAQHGST